jgi:hypothetical protein
MIASPTRELCRENYWDAIDPDTGRRYLDVIPLALVVDTNENEMAIVMRTQVEGQPARLIFRSADDPDRLRGPAFAGVVQQRRIRGHCGWPLRKRIGGVSSSPTGRV